jgi:hypothetical protein
MNPKTLMKAEIDPIPERPMVEYGRGASVK